MTLKRVLLLIALICLARPVQGQTSPGNAESLQEALRNAYARRDHVVQRPSVPVEEPVPPPAIRLAINQPPLTPPAPETAAADLPASVPDSTPAPRLADGRARQASDPDDSATGQTQSAGPTPWWSRIVTEPQGDREYETVYPEVLVQMAMQNSPSILAISLNPLIQETEVTYARAQFDTDLFLRSQYDDRVDPVGNQLTTGGGLPFLKDNIWYGEGGLRRKLYAGGEIELKQRLGFQNSNSNFFDPQDQGTATLALNFSQPLMRGSGRYYNRSQIMIAQTGTNVAWDKLAAELQDELTRLVEAYWSLYYSRAVLLQKRQNVERGEVVLLKLEGRSELDSLPSQISRARAAVRARATELANARRDVFDAETEIRRILGSPEAFQSNAPELVPGEPPQLTPNHFELANIITEAMQQRPEVKQAVQRAKIAAIQQNVSRNELLPELNLIFNTYVSALRGESDIPGAWTDQFQNSTPGFAGGLEFSMPWGRRAARARLTRQQLVVEQVRHEIDQVMHRVVAEAQVAWRTVDSAFQTAVAAGLAIEAARADLLQNEARWESFALVEGDFAEGQTPTTLLDQLLDAQQRLTNAELTYSQALLEFKVAEIALKRATGTLLSCYNGPIPDSFDDGGNQLAPAEIPNDEGAPSDAPQPPGDR